MPKNNGKGGKPLNLNNKITINRRLLVFMLSLKILKCADKLRAITKIKILKQYKPKYIKQISDLKQMGITFHPE